MSVRYRSATVRKETLHTLSLVLPELSPGMSVLDIGCGEGYVGEEVAHQGEVHVHGVDVVDVRRTRALPFSLYDGRTVPFPDDWFDLVMLNFVLHHVPDEHKVPLLREAMRVTRRAVFILEDTPTTPIDRFVSNRHGLAYRRKIESSAPFGFLTPDEWLWLFRGMGVQVESRALGRFCRSFWQPFARTAFVLRKSPVNMTRAGTRGDSVGISPRVRDEGSSSRIAMS